MCTCPYVNTITFRFSLSTLEIWSGVPPSSLSLALQALESRPTPNSSCKSPQYPCNTSTSATWSRRRDYTKDLTKSGNPIPSTRTRCVPDRLIDHPFACCTLFIHLFRAWPTHCCFCGGFLQVLDQLEPLVSAGGVVLDWHTCDIYPERWADLVVVLRCHHTTLWDRLEKRYVFVRFYLYVVRPSSFGSPRGRGRSHIPSSC